MNGTELASAFETAFGRKLREAVTTLEEALALRPDRWVDAAVGALRDLGRQNEREVFPIRRGVSELGWEVVWGRHLVIDYKRLSQTNPAELSLDLVAEVVEGSFRADTIPERVVEEVANDLARLLWARAPLKVLVFGARREPEPASSIVALAAGLEGLIAARDKDSDYLLAALPNLEGSRHTAPAKATLWLQTIAKGRAGTLREVPLSKLLAS